MQPFKLLTEYLARYHHSPSPRWPLRAPPRANGMPASVGWKLVGCANGTWVRGARGAVGSAPPRHTANKTAAHGINRLP